MHHLPPLPPSLSHTTHHAHTPHKNTTTKGDDLEPEVGNFSDEEDLAVTAAAALQQQQRASNVKKGNALKKRQEAEEARRNEEEMAKREIELENEAMSKLSVAERRVLEREKQAEGAMGFFDDDFDGEGSGAGSSDEEGADGSGGGGGGGRRGQSSSAAAAGGAALKVDLKTIKSTLQTAHMISGAVKGADSTSRMKSTLLKEIINILKDDIDEDGVSEIIKCCNVIKNDKQQASKTKQSAANKKKKKDDKLKQKKAKKIYQETFGDNDCYDGVDDYGAQYEDEYF